MSKKNKYCDCKREVFVYNQYRNGDIRCDKCDLEPKPFMLPTKTIEINIP